MSNKRKAGSGSYQKKVITSDGEVLHGQGTGPRKLFPVECGTRILTFFSRGSSCSCEERDIKVVLFCLFSFLILPFSSSPAQDLEEGKLPSIKDFGEDHHRLRKIKRELEEFWRTSPYYVKLEASDSKGK